MRDSLKSVLGSVIVHFIAGVCLISLGKWPISPTKKQDESTCVSLVWKGECKAQSSMLEVLTLKSSSVPVAVGVGALKSKEQEARVKTQPIPEKKIVTLAIPKKFSKPFKLSEKQDHSTFVPVSLQKPSPGVVHSLKGGTEEGAFREPAAKLTPVYAPKPHYPEEARRLRQEGVALVRVWLTKDGRVLRCVLVQTTGFQSLDGQALKAVSLWRFRVASGFVESALVPVRFSLVDN